DDGHGGGGSPGASSQRRDGADCGGGPGAVPGGGSAEEAGDDGPDDDGSDDDGSTSSSSSSSGSADTDHDGVRSLLLRAERRFRAQSAFEEVKELRSEVTRHQTLAESTLRVNRSLRKQVDDLEGKLEGYRRAVSVLKRNELRAEERRAANEAEYMNQLNDLVEREDREGARGGAQEEEGGGAAAAAAAAGAARATGSGRRGERLAAGGVRPGLQRRERRGRRREELRRLDAERYPPQAAHVHRPLPQARVQPRPALRPHDRRRAVECRLVRHLTRRRLRHEPRLDHVYGLRDEARHQGARDPYPDVLGGGERRRAVAAVPPAPPPLEPDQPLPDDVPGREGRDYEGHIPGYRRLPRRVEPPYALRPVDLAERLAEAPVDPRDETLKVANGDEVLVCTTQEPAAPATDAARGPKRGFTAPNIPNCIPPVEQREARGLRAPPHEGPDADVREGPPVARLGEGPEGVDGVEKGLGERAADPPGEDRGRPAGRAGGAAAGGQRPGRRRRTDYATDVGDAPRGRCAMLARRRNRRRRRTTAASAAADERRE
ncbi:hypothetical protein THAOC_37367, partial [Thalassiosira oceanica]